MKRVITLTNPTLIAQFKKLMADKESFHKKISEGKISHIIVAYETKEIKPK